MRDAILPRLRGTLWGRLVVLAVATKVLIAVAAIVVDPPFLLSLLDALASTTLVVVGLYGVVKLFGVASRTMLWRVRRKLILSYVFIGLVPALLIAVFFVGAGLLTFLNLSSILLQRGSMTSSSRRRSRKRPGDRACGGVEPRRRAAHPRES